MSVHHCHLACIRPCLNCLLPWLNFCSHTAPTLLGACPNGSGLCLPCHHHWLIILPPGKQVQSTTTPPRTRHSCRLPEEKVHACLVFHTKTVLSTKFSEECLVHSSDNTVIHRQKRYCLFENWKKFVSCSIVLHMLCWAHPFHSPVSSNRSPTEGLGIPVICHLETPAVVHVTPGYWECQML